MILKAVPQAALGLGVEAEGRPGSRERLLKQSDGVAHPIDIQMHCAGNEAKQSLIPPFRCSRCTNSMPALPLLVAQRTQISMCGGVRPLCAGGCLTPPNVAGLAPELAARCRRE